MAFSANSTIMRRAMARVVCGKMTFPVVTMAKSFRHVSPGSSGCADDFADKGGSTLSSQRRRDSSRGRGFRADRPRLPTAPLTGRLPADPPLIAVYRAPHSPYRLSNGQTPLRATARCRPIWRRSLMPRISCEGAGWIRSFVVFRELIENLVHASFREVVVTIMDGGNTLRISDRGPGILDKDAALRPGFTTATARMRKCIRGVGSGLAVAKPDAARHGRRVGRRRQPRQRNRDYCAGSPPARNTLAQRPSRHIIFLSVS